MCIRDREKIVCMRSLAWMQKSSLTTHGAMNLSLIHISADLCIALAHGGTFLIAAGFQHGVFAVLVLDEMCIRDSCSTVDANFLAMVPVAKIPHFITVPPGLLLWIRCVQYTMVFPCGDVYKRQHYFTAFAP